MRVIAIYQGKFGRRFVEYLQKTAPSSWETVGYEYTSKLPAVIDDPQDILPEDLPTGDLLLYLGQNNKLAELIPEIALQCKVAAVIAPVDNRALLPTGLANQIKRQLDRKGVKTAFPGPFCGLVYDDDMGPLIREFSRCYGKPKLKVRVDGDQIVEVSVLREAPCGNTSYVTERLGGVGVEEAVERAGQLHREHPCMATMNMDREIGDTLLKKAGALLEEALIEALKGSD
ncbi:MAG: hypothetical protein HY788_21735 [Deltaproteobacteria bacterium]|nr:hypothetical protein [Deltaproteobacteria bacterium]